jgi:hypothetical protein
MECFDLVQSSVTILVHFSVCHRRLKATFYYYLTSFSFTIRGLPIRFERHGLHSRYYARLISVFDSVQGLDETPMSMPMRSVKALLV